MLHYGQELHVGKAHTFDVISELRGKLPVGERSSSILGRPHPGTQVNLVDCHWRIKGVSAASFAYPSLIAPGVFQIPDNGASSGWDLVVEGKGIGLVYPVPPVP